MSKISVTSLFERDNVDRTQDFEGNLMVTLKAEDPSFKRTPICTALVLDVSGSMGSHVPNAGKSKLELVKDTARKIVQNLTEDDEISIVTYSDVSQVILKRVNAGNKSYILQAIDTIHTMGCTNLSAGFFDGIGQINEDFKGVQRIMLLTDGLANSGISGRDGLIDMVKNRDSKCTVSTFGFGLDADQELLADMAKAGEGNYYYIDSNDISSVFARELGGLASCMGQNIEVVVKPSDRNEVIDVLNDYTVEDVDDAAVIKAEDIYAEETKHVLVKMKLGKPNGHAKDRPVTIADVTVKYDDLKTGKKVTEKLKPKVKFVKPEDADDDAKLEVSEQAALLEASKAQIEAAQRASQGDFAGAQGILNLAAVNLTDCFSKGSAVAGDFLVDYNAQQENFTADNYNEMIGSSVSSSARGMLRHKATTGYAATCYSNTSQSNMVDNFVQPTETGDVDITQQPAEPPQVQDVVPPKKKFTKKRSRG